jgi:ubiquinone biosynthesis O-methyltransferase
VRVGALAEQLCTTNMRRALRGLPSGRGLRFMASTVDPAEVAKFGLAASKWWDESSREFGALHKMNAVRVPLVVEALCPRSSQVSMRPLSGRDVLDVGCGGGILAEALARSGARVLGIDASPENIAAASLHASLDEEVLSRVRYANVLSDDLANWIEGHSSPPTDKAEGLSLPQGGFHCVVASEVVEHVADPDRFVTDLARCALPGGAVVLTTITRSALSYAGAIFAAEVLAGWVPQGTHDWSKFLRPEELQQCMHKAGLEVRGSVQRIQWDPVRDVWTRDNWDGRAPLIQYALVGYKRTVD